MIRFSIIVDNEQDTKTFLKAIVSDYITVFASEKVCYFIGMNAAVYCHEAFSVLSSRNLNNLFIFRIPKSRFIALLKEGMIEFEIENDSVSIAFKGNSDNTIYTYKTKLQVDVLKKYQEKIELLEQANNYPRVDLEPLTRIAAIASKINACVTSNNDYTFIQMPDMIIFKKSNVGRLCIDGKTLYYILRLRGDIYNAKNYIVLKKGSRAMIITQRRGSFDTEVDFILDKPYAYKINIKLNTMIDLCKNINLNLGKFIIDFNNSECKYIEDGEYNSYTSKIEVLNIESSKVNKAKKAEVDDFSDLNLFDDDAVVDLNKMKKSMDSNLPSLVIPSNVLKNILSCFSSLVTVEFTIKKDFVIIKVGELFITFRRINYHE